MSGNAAALALPVVLGQHGPWPSVQHSRHAHSLSHRHHLPLAASARLVQQDGQGVDQIIKREREKIS